MSSRRCPIALWSWVTTRIPSCTIKENIQRGWSNLKVSYKKPKPELGGIIIFGAQKKSSSIQQDAIQSP